MLLNLLQQIILRATTSLRSLNREFRNSLLLTTLVIIICNIVTRTPSSASAPLLKGLVSNSLLIMNMYLSILRLPIKTYRSKESLSQVVAIFYPWQLTVLEAWLPSSFIRGPRSKTKCNKIKVATPWIPTQWTLQIQHPHTRVIHSLDSM